MRRALLIAVLAAVFAAADAGAMPAFARHYQLSCTNCHDPFPRLNPYGAEFAANGFMRPDGDYLTAGDDLLRLNRDFPVAARLDLRFQWQEERTATDTDFQTPWGLKLLSGGTLARNVGYYFKFFLAEGGEVTGVEDAYLHFNDIFGQPLDLLVGQFQVCDLLLKRGLRLTYEDYGIYRVKVGESRADLTYDRGVTVPYTLEATGTDVVAMVVNGNGKPAAEGGKMDDDHFKNYALRVNQALGDVASVGGFGYWGKEQTAIEVDFGLRDSLINDITYYGVDATLSLGGGLLDLRGQYLQREDSRPFVARDEPRFVHTDGIVAEVVIAPHRDRSRHYFTLLYNQVDGDLAENDFESFTAGTTYLLQRNLRFDLEYSLLEELDRDAYARVSVGLVSAF
jgi:hypothetical protein